GASTPVVNRSFERTAIAPTKQITTKHRSKNIDRPPVSAMSRTAQPSPAAAEIMMTPRAGMPGAAAYSVPVDQSGSTGPAGARVIRTWSTGLGSTNGTDSSGWSLGTSGSAQSRASGCGDVDIGPPLDGCRHHARTGATAGC